MRRTAFLAGCAAATLSPVASAAYEGLHASSLHVAIANAATHSSGHLAVFARTMSPHSPVVAYHEDEIFPAASIIKLLIMVSAFRYSEQRDPMLFDRKVALRAEDMVGGSESLAYAQPGQHFTIGALIRAMITVSDNTAANALITYLGFERINRTAERLGLRHTHLRRHFLDSFAIVRHIQNLTSARDMAMLLYGIERGAREGIPTVASPHSCRRMINILLQQEDREKIAQGLPHGIPLANKTGEISGVRNDVGIVDPYGDQPYVLAILTKDLDNYADGIDAIIRVTRRVHRAFVS